MSRPHQMNNRNVNDSYSDDDLGVDFLANIKTSARSQHHNSAPTSPPSSVTCVPTFAASGPA
jgi:hypothetical protein